MSRHKEAYVISYHGALCHDMSYVTTIMASLVYMCADQQLLKHWSHNNGS